MRKPITIIFCLSIFVMLTTYSANLIEKANTIKAGSDLALKKNQISDTIAPDSNELTSIYTRAIHDFIEAIYQKDKTVFDTLFFIQHKNGLADDFPDIQLPESIKQTKLLLFTQQEAENHKSFYHEASPCINLIGDVNENTSDFIFVAFFPEFQHQYDCYIHYNFDRPMKDYELEYLRIEVLIYDKNGKPDHYAVYQDGKQTGNKPIQ